MAWSMRNRTWWLLAGGGGLAITVVFDLSDLALGKPEGVMRIVLWPADLLFWASGPGVPVGRGGYEWTPVQDLAMWVGIRMSWAFWVCVMPLLWAGRRLARRSKRSA
jgi:hypothetical protein